MTSGRANTPRNERPVCPNQVRGYHSGRMDLHWIEIETYVGEQPIIAKAWYFLCDGCYFSTPAQVTPLGQSKRPPNTNWLTINREGT